MSDTKVSGIFRPGGLSWRERRELGLTGANIYRTTKKLKDTGQLDQCATRDEMAQLVLNTIMEENRKAWQKPELDWDSLLALIEKLLPLILMIIDMFS